MYNSNGFCAFLVAIDLFSRKIWAIPLKSKNSEDVAKALMVVVNEYVDMGVQIQTLHTDDVRSDSSNQSYCCSYYCYISFFI